MGSPEGGGTIFGALKLTSRVEKLEDRLATVERDIKNATLDYLDLYAKAKKLYGRVAKAQERAEAAGAEDGAEPAENLPANFSSLSPRAQMITRQILARRRAEVASTDSVRRREDR